jgi:hypothetical protein
MGKFRKQRRNKTLKYGKKLKQRSNEVFNAGKETEALLH